MRSYLPDAHPDKQYELGLEPTFDLYLERMVGVFREVRRVMRPDSLLAINMGDSYQCSPNGRAAADIVGDDRTFRDKPRVSRGARKASPKSGAADFCEEGPNRFPQKGLKAKDLVCQPWALAMALRADGWWLRSAMPWVKRSAMPESCTDRPSTALEYVFLLSKSASYYYDADAVRRKAEYGRREWSSVVGNMAGIGLNGSRGKASVTGGDPESGRNLRNSDFYFDSLDLAIERAKAELAHLTHLRERGGLLLSEAGEPLALDVNTEASSVDHFASFPRKLVQPLVQAGTSERGCCAECGAPWARVSGRQGEQPKVAPSEIDRYGTGDAGVHRKIGGAYQKWLDENPKQTLGWHKSCRCETDQSQPCTVLDPFAGTGTTLFVAMELGRRAIGCELSEKYVGIMRRRLRRAQLPLDLVAD